MTSLAPPAGASSAPSPAGSVEGDVWRRPQPWEVADSDSETEESVEALRSSSLAATASAAAGDDSGPPSDADEDDDDRAFSSSMSRHGAPLSSSHRDTRARSGVRASLLHSSPDANDDASAHDIESGVQYADDADASASSVAPAPRSRLRKVVSSLPAPLRAPTRVTLASLGLLPAPRSASVGPAAAALAWAGLIGLGGVARGLWSLVVLTVSVFFGGETGTKFVTKADLQAKRIRARGNAVAGQGNVVGKDGGVGYEPTEADLASLGLPPSTATTGHDTASTGYVDVCDGGDPLAGASCAPSPSSLAVFIIASLGLLLLLPGLLWRLQPVAEPSPLVALRLCPLPAAPAHAATTSAAPGSAAGTGGAEEGSKATFEAWPPAGVSDGGQWWSSSAAPCYSGGIATTPTGALQEAVTSPLPLSVGMLYSPTLYFPPGVVAAADVSLVEVPVSPEGGGLLGLGGTGSSAASSSGASSATSTGNEWREVRRIRLHIDSRAPVDVATTAVAASEKSAAAAEAAAAAAAEAALVIDDAAPPTVTYFPPTPFPAVDPSASAADAEMQAKAQQRPLPPQSVSVRTGAMAPSVVAPRVHFGDAAAAAAARPSTPAPAAAATSTANDEAMALASCLSPLLGCRVLLQTRLHAAPLLQAAIAVAPPKPLPPTTTTTGGLETGMGESSGWFHAVSMAHEADDDDISAAAAAAADAAAAEEEAAATAAEAEAEAEAEKETGAEAEAGAGAAAAGTGPRGGAVAAEAEAVKSLTAAHRRGHISSSGKASVLMIVVHSLTAYTPSPSQPRAPSFLETAQPPQSAPPLVLFGLERLSLTRSQTQGVPLVVAGVALLTAALALACAGKVRKVAGFLPGGRGDE